MTITFAEAATNELNQDHDAQQGLSWLRRLLSGGRREGPVFHREPRILEQQLEITLLPRPGETSEIHSVTLRAQTDYWRGDEVFRTAETQLAERRAGFLTRCGKVGVTIEDRFYPHSRIDHITHGDAVVIQEGTEQRR